jgi:kinetochore protein Mis13/DSN1
MKRNKMSFSTPNVREEKPVRRSKRLSDERDQREGSPQRKARRKEPGEPAPAATIPRERINQPPAREKTPTVASDVIEGEGHSATRIALPCADTPVIRRNKAMREGKVGKGKRRSSLGLRGRRASSLIDSGNSNGRRAPEPFNNAESILYTQSSKSLTIGTALPHNEVVTADFYKHIESEGLPEPRRMRQLLTWCATRAMGDKPTGTEFEDQSARMAGEALSATPFQASEANLSFAARVIQEELLKDLANRSEMSDWFSREDAPKTAAPLVTRPNPKNIQNAAKIQELEQQINRYGKKETNLLM